MLIYSIFELLKINHCNKIIPNLYLGNYHSVNLNNYDLIVNYNRELKDNFIKADKIRIPIQDNYIFKNNEILEYLDKLDIIDNYP